MTNVIIPKPSPNFLKGRTFGGYVYRPEAVVIHIMVGSLLGTDSWFASTTSGVSAHYGIGKKGEVHQYVAEADSASHAGIVENSVWKLLKPIGNPNYYTIGIEHEGQPTDVWTPEMKKASAELIADICKRWNIPIDRNHIIGHYEIRSSKPNCPAVNKGIIEELIKLASTGQIDPNNKILEAKKHIQMALDILNT